MIVSNSDFVGKYALALTQYNVDLIDSYISRYEPYYLNQLLGANLNNLLQAELLVNNPPTTPIYKIIYDPLTYDFYPQVISTLGIKEMLIGFIYYHYILDKQQNQTPIGTTYPNAENSNVLTLNSITINRFNESIESFKGIQQYIQDHISDYPTYNGQYLGYEYNW